MKPSENIPTLGWSIPTVAVGLIADEEQGPGGGPALRAYRCPAGKWTCGFGETERITPTTVCTERQAWDWLCVDIAKRTAAVQAMCTRDPGPHELGAMVSLAYNIGLAALKTSTVLRAHNAGDSAAAARAFGLFNKARVNGQLVPLAGLTRRRAREAALYLEDAPASRQPTPQAVEPQTTLTTSPIAQTGTIAGGVAVVDMLSKAGDAVGPVGTVLKEAKAVATETLGIPADWFLPCVLLAIAGIVLFQRYKQRAGGWA